MREEDLRTRLARWSALARLALGCVAVLTPDAVGRALAVQDAGRPAQDLLVRNVGGRDIALGLGSLLGLHRAAHPRAWLGMTALVDGLDLVFLILNWRNFPERRRWLFAVTAAGSAAAGALLTATTRSGNRATV